MIAVCHTTSILLSVSDPSYHSDLTPQNLHCISPVPSIQSSIIHKITVSQYMTHRNQFSIYHTQAFKQILALQFWACKRQRPNFRSSIWRGCLHSFAAVRCMQTLANLAPIQYGSWACMQNRHFCTRPPWHNFNHTTGILSSQPSVQPSVRPLPSSTA